MRVGGAGDNDPLPELAALEKKILWLSTWTIHNANHLRESRDGLKVGGHQASSASVATLMTALYFNVLRPEDRVAVKPHASPVFHAIQYLFGRQSKEKLERFRALGGAQAYPSRTKDADDVDFSTGSVGLGVAMTSFAALVQDYLADKGMLPQPKGRMVAIAGDAELDEGNIYEAMLEGWKHDVRNVWWVIDYNRQSLDNVVSDRLFYRIDRMFLAMDWRVVTLKYGKKLEAAFAGSDGDVLRQWIDDCPNSVYSALVYKGGAGWRAHLQADIGHKRGIKALLDKLDDDALHALMTNLAGHDLETVLEAFHAVPDDKPTAFICYTIKGHGLPFAGHKDNHAGLMNEAQMAGFRKTMRIPDGAEWDAFAGLDLPPARIKQFLAAVPFAQKYPRRHAAPAVEVPETLAVDITPRMSTQEGFGRVMNELGRADSELARRIVTTSPDVTVSTNLGGWVNRRGLYSRLEREDVFKHEGVVSAQHWKMTRAGQHIELGIAENNLFILLGALGLSHELFGTRLMPVGTLYDPFIARGLDALTYALYQGARFMLVATPSGITLAPEGGAHQSVGTPLIGMAADGLAAFEPAYVDELAAIMAWGFRHMQAEKGGAVYLRLSTRPLDQPQRALTPALRDAVITGGYWAVPPGPDCNVAIAYTGAVAAEAHEAHTALLEDIPGAALLAITSADRLHEDWQSAKRARRSGNRDVRAPVERLLDQLPRAAAIVSVIDGHPAVLSWLGAVGGHRAYPLGVEKFGQSADIPDLYRVHGIDADAILDAAARAMLARLAR
ncbi:MAG TPA: 1-deoxy-D-xylulose-5-phosphate synthase N-terminal domain-containing protein [Alphaproteobacteria bacterium]